VICEVVGDCRLKLGHTAVGRQGKIIAKLNTAAVGALADAAVRSRLFDLGFEIFSRDG
jgi:hypothetical protein